MTNNTIIATIKRLTNAMTTVIDNTSTTKATQMSKTTVSDKIIERAVELWVRQIRDKAGRFDNGDTSDSAGLTIGLHTMLVDAEMSKVPDFGAAVEKFRTALTDRLKFERDNEGKPMSDADVAAVYGKRLSHHPSYRLTHNLGVDYDPCTTLAIAADAAGVPYSVFGCKNNVGIDYNGLYVESSFGYAAPYKYHYLLPNGDWLITTICPQDSDDWRKVVEGVMNGTLALTVEKSDT